MYVVRNGDVGDTGPPGVPMTADMILPAGEEFADFGQRASTRTSRAPASSGKSTINWAKFGEDMLRQGIKDTTSLIGGALSRAGRTRVQVPPPTYLPPPAPRPSPGAYMPSAAYAPAAVPAYRPLPPAKAGLPSWAWVLVAVGGVVVVGGIAYKMFGK